MGVIVAVAATAAALLLESVVAGSVVVVAVAKACPITMSMHCSCTYGEKWQKKSILCSKNDDWVARRGCKMDCGSVAICPKTKRLRHIERIGQDQSHSLYKKHRLPAQLQLTKGHNTINRSSGNFAIFCVDDNADGAADGKRAAAPAAFRIRREPGRPSAAR